MERAGCVEGGGRGRVEFPESGLRAHAPFIVRHGSNIRSACTWPPLIYIRVPARAQVFVRALAAIRM